MHYTMTTNGKQYGYHCTQVDPQTILRDGFKNGQGGYTPPPSHFSAIEVLYERHLPKTPMFLSDLHAKVWDTDAEWCMKIDVTGLQLYPDFGHLMEYNPRWTELESYGRFVWDTYDFARLRSFRGTVFGSTEEYEKMCSFIKKLRIQDGRRYLYAKDFTGEMSRDLLGTFAIDGSMLTRDRVVEVR